MNKYYVVSYVRKDSEQRYFATIASCPTLKDAKDLKELEQALKDMYAYEELIILNIIKLPL